MKKIVRTAHVDKVKPSISAESIIVDIDFLRTNLVFLL